MKIFENIGFQNFTLQFSKEKNFDYKFFKQICSNFVETTCFHKFENSCLETRLKKCLEKTVLVTL